MNRDETNGALRVIEQSLRDVEAMMRAVRTQGSFSDEADQAIHNCYIDIVNLSQAFLAVRGWNGLPANRR